MDEILTNSASFLREHSWTLCYAWSASLLVIYGRELANLAKSIAKSWLFLFRVLFFMLICGFAYGLLTIHLTKMIHRHLVALSDTWYIAAIFCAFFALGIMADKKKHI